MLKDALNYHRHSSLRRSLPWEKEIVAPSGGKSGGEPLVTAA
jgi:hypothetical protein